MVDMSAIAGTMSALNGAVDIAKTMIGLHDAKAVEAKVLELNSKILDAQSTAFAANDERAVLLDKVRKLEEEISSLKAWGAEKDQYEFTEVSSGVFAYTPKPDTQRAKTFHMLCANCFDRGERTTLQATQELDMRRRVHICPHCKSKFTIGEPVPRSAPGQAIMDYDPFTGR
jgi:hypothetical protein